MGTLDLKDMQRLLPRYIRLSENVRHQQNAHVQNTAVKINRMRTFTMNGHSPLTSGKAKGHSNEARKSFKKTCTIGSSK